MYDLAVNVHHKIVTKQRITFNGRRSKQYTLSCACGWKYERTDLLSKDSVKKGFAAHRIWSHPDETPGQTRNRVLRETAGGAIESGRKCPCTACAVMLRKIQDERMLLDSLEKQKAAYAEKMEAELAIENRAAEIHRDAEQARNRVAEIVAKFTR